MKNNKQDNMFFLSILNPDNNKAEIAHNKDPYLPNFIPQKKYNSEEMINPNTNIYI